MAVVKCRLLPSLYNNDSWEINLVYDKLEKGLVYVYLRTQYCRSILYFVRRILYKRVTCSGFVCNKNSAVLTIMTKVGLSVGYWSVCILLQRISSGLESAQDRVSYIFSQLSVESKMMLVLIFFYHLTRLKISLLQLDLY